MWLNLGKDILPEGT
jgi:hypothetical protein